MFINQLFRRPSQASRSIATSPDRGRQRRLSSKTLRSAGAKANLNSNGFCAHDTVQMTTRDPNPAPARRRAKQRKNARKIAPEAPATKRGEQAKAKFKRAAQRLLERKSYRELRLSDIVDAAGYNIATFYYYFKDKQSIVREVIADIFPHDALVAEYRANQIALGDLHSVILATTRSQIRAFAQHPGLMRSIAQFADDEPELAEIVHRRDELWTELIADDIHARFAGKGVSRAFALAFAVMLNGAVRTFLTEIYVQKNQGLTAHFQTEEDLAEFIAAFWWRATFLENPSLDQLGHSTEFVSLKQIDEK